MLNFYKLTFITFFSTSLLAQVTPSATIISSPSIACTDMPVLFSVAVSATPTAYSWSVFPEKNVISSDPTASNFFVTFPKDLTYTVSVAVTTASGSVTKTKPVTVFRSAKASFNASLNSAGYPAELILTNFSTSSIKNYWLYSGELSPDSSFHTSKHYSGSGSYSVTLISFGQKGCNDTARYAFRIVDSSSVKLPNVFSPNGDDINDIFRPLITGISSLNCWIYTRDGQTINKWTTVNGFWDGTNSTGEACPEGVYFVVLEAFGFEGKTYKLHSTLTLVR